MRLLRLLPVAVIAAAGVLIATPAPAPANGPSGLVEAAPVAKDEPDRDKVRIDQRLGNQVPLDLVFRDESERPISLREAMNGKVTILVPVYFRCPMLCTKVLNGLLDALRGLSNEYDFVAGNQFTVLTVSMDPKEHADLGAPKKAAYIAEYGQLDPKDPYEKGWRFLTGKKEPVAELLDAVGYHYEFDKAFKEYNHPSGIIILTPQGKVSRYFLGIGYDDDDPQVPRDGEGKRIAAPTWKTLKLSLVEASDGKIGSLADNLLLICYRFDHLSQGYSLRVMRVVQLGGVVTLVAIGAWLTVAIRRDRRRRAVPAADVAANGTQNGQPGVPA